MTPMKGAMSNEGIQGLMKSGDVRLGQAPQTPKLTLDRKKEGLEGQINKEKWIARKNKKIKMQFEDLRKKTQEQSKILEIKAIGTLMAWPKAELRH